MIIGELEINKMKNNAWKIQKKTNHNNNTFWKYINYMQDKETDNDGDGDAIFMKNNKITVDAYDIISLTDFLSKWEKISRKEKMNG